MATPRSNTTPTNTPPVPGTTTQNGAPTPGTPEQAGGENFTPSTPTPDSNKTQVTGSDKSKGASKFSANDEPVQEYDHSNQAPRGKMDTMQIVAFLATKADANEAYHDLLKRNKVADPRATEIELKRLGHVIL